MFNRSFLFVFSKLLFIIRMVISMKSKIIENKKIKENNLLQAAFNLFTKEDITNVSVNDIVKNAGVAKGTFYLYFKDKYDVRNKLISHKTGELFYHAHEALARTDICDFEEQVHFIVDYILTELDRDHTLLLFISKNLSWGIFKGAFEEKMPDEDYHFYQSYLDMLSKSRVTYENPELLLFTIIELVGSSCYSCILYQQPVPLVQYRPYLHASITAIMKTFEVAPAQPI